MNNFKVVSKVMDDMAVLYPQGYLNNIGAESLEKECTAYLKNGIKKIVLNFNDVELINSIGISILLSVIEKMKEFDGSFLFTNMSKLHDETFEMLGLKKYVQIFEKEDDALRHLRGKKR